MATSQRTVTTTAWSRAVQASPTSPGQINKSIDAIMAELLQSVIPSSAWATGYMPWIRPSEPCSGVMWASVPHMTEYWRDDEGGWMIAQHGNGGPIPHSRYLRLSPAPEGQQNLVQYGFCPLRLNRLGERMREAGEQNELRLVQMIISTGRSSGFRADRMAVSAVRLSATTNVSPESERFRELLGRRSMGVFVEDMLRGCYSDSPSAQNVLRNRDNRYQEMIYLVAGSAYRDWMSPTTESGLDRFKTAMGLSHEYLWENPRVWPYLYNVVMPRSIFEANSRNLESGIPPIIPHYVTPRDWMFNGPWSSPCAGLTFTGECGVTGLGRKPVAGILCRSNLDLTGPVSFWPTRDNPPQEWVDSFARCVDRVRNLDMPLDIEDRVDLVLHESRCIPLMFRVHKRSDSATVECPYKFVRMVSGLSCPDTHVPLGIRVQECNPSGDESIGVEVNSGNPTGEGMGETNDGP